MILIPELNLKSKKIKIMIFENQRLPTYLLRKINTLLLDNLLKTKKEIKNNKAICTILYLDSDDDFIINKNYILKYIYPPDIQIFILKEELKKQRKRQWKLDNPDKCNAYYRKYYAKNKEKLSKQINENKKRRRKENKNKKKK